MNKPLTLLASREMSSKEKYSIKKTNVWLQGDNPPLPHWLWMFVCFCTLWGEHPVPLCEEGEVWSTGWVIGFLCAFLQVVQQHSVGQQTLLRLRLFRIQGEGPFSGHFSFMSSIMLSLQGSTLKGPLHSSMLLSAALVPAFGFIRSFVVHRWGDHPNLLYLRHTWHCYYKYTAALLTNRLRRLTWSCLGTMEPLVESNCRG